MKWITFHSCTVLIVYSSNQDGAYPILIWSLFMAESLYGYTRGQSCLWMAPPPENWGKPLTGLGTLGGNWSWQVATQPVNTLESQPQSHILVHWNDLSEERVARLLEKGDFLSWLRASYVDKTLETIWLHLNAFYSKHNIVRKIFLCECQNGRHT